MSGGRQQQTGLALISLKGLNLGHMVSGSDVRIVCVQNVDAGEACDDDETCRSIYPN